MFANNHHNDGRIAVWLPAPPGLQEMLIQAAPENTLGRPTSACAAGLASSWITSATKTWPFISGTAGDWWRQKSYRLSLTILPLSLNHRDRHDGYTGLSERAGMRLVLIRHAESEHAVRGLVGGPLGCRGLTACGCQQAERLAQHFHRTGELADCAAFLTSPFPAPGKRPNACCPHCRLRP